MAKIHDFSASRAKRLRATKGFALAAMIAAAVLIVAAASLVSLGEYSTTALGHASANARIHASQPMTSAGAGETAAQGADADRGFDYFPDHYRNQATEPAEPIATF